MTPEARPTLPCDKCGRVLATTLVFSVRKLPHGKAEDWRAVVVKHHCVPKRPPSVPQHSDTSTPSGNSGTPIDGE